MKQHLKTTVLMEEGSVDSVCEINIVIATEPIFTFDTRPELYPVYFTI